ncbi:putative ribonuclease H-like domain-containing protein [Tanacetum coccineum]
MEVTQPEFEGYGPKTSKSISEDISNEVRESLDTPLVEELVSVVDKFDKNIIFPTVSKIEFVRPKQQENPVRNPVNFDRVQANCNYHQRERVVSGSNYTRVNYNYSTKKAHPNAHRNMAPRAVLMKTGLRPLNTVRHVNTAHPKTTVYSARPMPKAVNTARPNSAVVNVVRANQVNVVKASACWVWRPTKLNSASITLKRHNYVDARGRSKHMTGNVSYLSNFKEFDVGYVTFRGGAKGGRITGKGTLKTGKLNFEDVYFVKELQFKLFSVLLKVPRKNNMYSVDMKNIILKESLTCLVAMATLDESMLWHKRLDLLRFFLASKDETSGILKNFITQIENLVDKKVKIIRRNNGTEFKNRVMSEFCETKVIKREFSAARTPQQNGVAERRNRTLIEATRTMLVDSKLPTTF